MINENEQNKNQITQKKQAMVCKIDFECAKSTDVGSRFKRNSTLLF